MIKKILLIILLNLPIIFLQAGISQQEFSQNPKIDSLLTVLKQLPPNKEGKGGPTEITRLSTLNKLSWEYINTGDYDKALHYANEVVATVGRLSRVLGEAGEGAVSVAYHNIGTVHYSKGNYDKAIEYFLKSSNIKGKNENKVDKRGMASTYNNIGVIYYVQGNYGKAIEYYIKSLKIYEAIGAKSEMASSYHNIGLIHKEQGNYAKAIEYSIMGLKIEKEFGNKSGIAFSYHSIGGIHDDNHEYDKAIEYYIKSLNIFEETGDKKGMAVTYSDIGSLYTKLFKKDTLAIGVVQKEVFAIPRYALLDSARHYNLKGYALSREIGDKNTMINSLAALGNILYEKKSYKEALHFYEQAASLADSIGAKKELYGAYKGLSEIHNKLGNGTKAYEYLNKSIALRDTVQSQEVKENMVRMEMQHEYEKKEGVAKAQQDKKDALAVAERKKEKAIRYSVIGGLVLMFVIALVIFRSLRITRKQKHIIELKNKETEEQKKVIEEHQKDIMDSMRYAQRIQQAILAKEEDILNIFPESYLFYKPKDIVAGDFYFFETTATHVFYAAADCTGHGVPGALVSVVCSNALTRCIKEFSLTDPAKILDKTRELVIDTFKKSGQEVKDGMDISLISLKFNPSTSLRTSVQSLPAGQAGSKFGEAVEVKWAGANNPLWVIRPVIASEAKQSLTHEQIASLPPGVRNDGFQLTEIKPDKQPIGQTENSRPFTSHTIELKQGSTIFLFTDGYADQFGGENLPAVTMPAQRQAGGKKFKYAKLKELLLVISHKPQANERTETNT